MEGLDSLQTTAQILSHPTWDIVVVFALIAAGFFYSIMAGKTRIAAIILYTYVAFALTSVLPLELLKSDFNSGLWKSDFAIRAGAFFAIFLLLALLLGSRRGAGRAPANSWWQIFLLSFLQVGLLIHIFLSFLPPERIEVLAPITRSVFANPDFRIWWFVVPIGVLVLLRRLEEE